uniref:hypothetical protein n=1 Tax=Caulobacter sp. CCH9-E1 TaxID=1768768 RepID=UPI001E28EA86
PRWNAERLNPVHFFGGRSEAFAGLVRDGSLTEVEFWRRIQIDAARDPLLIDEIRSYVNRATFQVSAH